MQCSNIGWAIEFELIGIFRGERIDDGVDFTDEVLQFDLLKINFNLAGFDL